MQTTLSSHQAFAQARRQTWIARGLGLAALAGVAIIFFLAASYHTTVVKKEAPVSMLMPVEAPPPPPPPKEIKQETAETQPIEQPITPTQQITRDNAITQNADAQEGGDSFGIGAGSGEGTRGAGVAGMFNRGPYALYMAKAIARAVEADKALAARLSQISVRVWVSSAGKITRLELASSTGSAEVDRALQDFIRGMAPFDQAPPQSILDSLPVEMTVRVHRT